MPTGGCGVRCVPRSFKFAGMFESWSKATMLLESWQQFCRKNSWSIAQNAPQKKVSRHTTISNLSNGCCSPTQKFANVLFPIACDCRSGLRYFIRKGILNKYFEILVDYTFLHEKTCTTCTVQEDLDSSKTVILFLKLVF